MSDVKARIVVLFPLFNGEKSILQSLQCIANQTFTDFKAVIVENHSTDQSFKIAREFAATDSRFEVVQNEYHLDALTNFVDAIKAHQHLGKYLVLRAHDDFSAPNFLEELAKSLDENLTKNLAVCDTHYVKEGSVVEKTKLIPSLMSFREHLISNKAPRRLVFRAHWFYGMYRVGGGTETLLRLFPSLGTPWCSASVVVAEFIFREKIVHNPNTHFEFVLGSQSQQLYGILPISQRLKRRYDYFMAIWKMKRFVEPLTFRQRLKVFEIAWRDCKKKTGYYIWGM